jgi:hypothetical protein
LGSLSRPEPDMFEEAEERSAFAGSPLSSTTQPTSSLVDDMHSVRIQSFTRSVNTHWKIASIPRRHAQRALGTFAVGCASNFQECALC